MITIAQYIKRSAKRELSPRVLFKKHDSRCLPMVNEFRFYTGTGLYSLVCEYKDYCGTQFRNR